MYFLDASKDFDRVNHFKLFVTMCQKGVPKCIVKILSYLIGMPTSQCRLNWVFVFLPLLGSAMGSNKVEFCRQFIFNLYFDDVSKSLKACNTGCMLGKPYYVCR